ncbi:MFS transporter [Penicillium brevicompactum]|uniref:MFS transporter n=1 Tax=Penicillium brevicompactum TaxID=5074 RepID=A0A9W9UJG8_PENBR|nr:MFS transporter [Penicillium brevicompactum]
MEKQDLESQKPTPRVDPDSEDDLALKPQQSNAYGIPTWRKSLILFIVSWMTLAVTFSSTSLLPATPEIATEFSTTSEILNVTNAGVLLAMGFSCLIWGPIVNICGRRNAYNVAILVLCACSAGTAVATTLHIFIAMRILSGFTGTFFMVAGQTIIADIFEPQQCLTCGLLSTFQYAILTSARSIFNPRFNLTTPLVSGLFYLAPGIGFLVGSVVGGKLSDRAVKKWIKKRNGVRLPQDRLNSGIATLFGVLPAATLIYGWTLEEEVGGMVVPIIAAFFAGVGLMGAFNALNTYSAEAMPQARSETIGCKYIVQYIFAAGATAAVEPLINAIGVGWTFTICELRLFDSWELSNLTIWPGVFFAIIGGFLVLTIIRWGTDMQEWTERTYGLNKKPQA